MKSRWGARQGVVCAFLSLLAGTVRAQSDLPALEAFVDGVVASAMADHKIAGAQVAIVRNGVPLLVKGYGIDEIGPRR